MEHPTLSRRALSPPVVLRWSRHRICQTVSGEFARSPRHPICQTVSGELAQASRRPICRTPPGDSVRGDTRDRTGASAGCFGERSRGQIAASSRPPASRHERGPVFSPPFPRLLELDDAMPDQPVCGGHDGVHRPGGRTPGSSDDPRNVTADGFVRGIRVAKLNHRCLHNNLPERALVHILMRRPWRSGTRRGPSSCRASPSSAPPACTCCSMTRGTGRSRPS